MTDRGTWRQATNLVAADLEGNGESGDAEAMLEFAAVPLANGVPALASAFSTLINPQRPVARRPWMSPGITGRALGMAPTLEQVAPKITSRLTGAYLIGHNIGEDWTLLHRSCPRLDVAGLIDTLVLAERVRGRSGGAALTALLDEYHLTAWVHAAVSGGQPHRALWDAVGAALLLEDLARRHWRHDPPLAELLTAAAPSGYQPAQRPVFDPPGPGRDAREEGQ